MPLAKRMKNCIPKSQVILLQYHTLKSKLSKYRLKNIFGTFLYRLEEVEVLVVHNHHNQVILSPESERDTNPYFITSNPLLMAN